MTHTSGTHATDTTEGDASPIPSSFFWSLWIPAFAAMLWGMSVLFGRISARPPESIASPPPEPPPPEA